MSTKVEMFTGSKANQNAQRWLRQLEGAKLKPDSNDATYAWVFSRHLEPGSRADKWYTDTLTDADRKTWAKTLSLFNAKWPSVARTEPSTEDWQLKLEEHILPADLAGVRVDPDDDEESEYSHILWANELETLIQNIGDDKGLLIPVARRNLPKAILRCLPSKLNTWTLFLAAVRDISIHTLTMNAEDEHEREATNTAIASFASMRVHSPAPSPYRAPAMPKPATRVHWSVTTPTPPTPAPPPTPAHSFAQAPAAPPQTPQRAPATTLTSAGLVPRTPWSAQMGSATRVNQSPAPPQSKARGTEAFENLALQAIAGNLPRYATTPQGISEWTRDKAAWETGNGGAGREVTWASKPIPLSPGTAH